MSLWELITRNMAIYLTGQGFRMEAMSALPVPMTEEDVEAWAKARGDWFSAELSREQWRRDMAGIVALLRARENVWCALAADDIEAALKDAEKEA